MWAQHRVCRGSRRDATHAELQLLKYQLAFILPVTQLSILVLRVYEELGLKEGTVILMVDVGTRHCPGADPGCRALLALLAAHLCRAGLSTALVSP